MTQIHCPKCHKLLMKAQSANLEIVCKGCKSLVIVKLYSAKDLILTGERNTDSIEVISK